MSSVLGTAGSGGLKKSDNRKEGARRVMPTGAQPRRTEDQCGGEQGQGSGVLVLLVTGGARQVEVRRSEEHTSELQSQSNLVCRLLLEKKKKKHERIALCREAD